MNEFNLGIKVVTRAFRPYKDEWLFFYLYYKIYKFKTFNQNKVIKLLVLLIILVRQIFNKNKILNKMRRK